MYIKYIKVIRWLWLSIPNPVKVKRILNKFDSRQPFIRKYQCVHVCASAFVFQTETSAGARPGAVTMATKGWKRNREWKTGRKRHECLCACVWLCVWSCWFIIHLPTSKTMWSHWAHTHAHKPGWPRTYCAWLTFTWVWARCEGWGGLLLDGTYGKKRQESVTLRHTHTPMNTQYVITHSIRRMSGQLINETIPIGWPGLTGCVVANRSLFSPVMTERCCSVNCWQRQNPHPPPHLHPP